MPFGTGSTFVPPILLALAQLTPAQVAEAAIALRDLRAAYRALQENITILWMPLRPTSACLASPESSPLTGPRQKTTVSPASRPEHILLQVPPTARLWELDRRLTFIGTGHCRAPQILSASARQTFARAAAVTSTVHLQRHRVRPVLNIRFPTPMTLQSANANPLLPLKTTSPNLVLVDLE